MKETHFIYKQKIVQYIKQFLKIILIEQKHLSIKSIKLSILHNANFSIILDKKIVI